MDSKRATAQDNLWGQVKGHFTESFSGEMLFPQFTGEPVDAGEDWRDARWRNAYRYILILLAVVLLPIIAYNYYVGQWLLAGAVGALWAVMLGNLVLLSAGREAPASPLAVLVANIGLAIAAVYVGQDFALYFLYPLLVAVPVLVRWRASRVICLGTLLLILPLVLQRFQPMTVFAIALTLGLTWLVSAWLVFALTAQAKRLRGMAITDPLTGAFNRRYLELRAAKSVEDWARYERHESLLIFDIDFFKRINDKFGHAVGDKALQDLVKLISKRIRGGDTLCRFGGEEFVLLLSEADTAVATRVANELRSDVAAARILPEGSMTISIGVCDVSCATSVEHWFKLADAALYLAKSNGRNRVEVATTEPVVIPPRIRSVPVWR